MGKQPVSSLAQNAEYCNKHQEEPCGVEKEEEPCYDEMNLHKHYYSSKSCGTPTQTYCHQESCVSIGTMLIWFIVVAIVVWLILFAFNPEFIQERDNNGNPTGNIDYGQLLLWTAVISLVITFIIWIILKLRGSGSGWDC